jgi:putative oxidoreductase
MVKGSSNKSSKFIEITVFLLVLLWMYTAASKLLSFDHYQLQMYEQPLPHWMAFMLIWSLPPIEILTAILLIFPKLKIWGLLSSIILLIVFSVYVAFVAFHVFERVSCSCGGILKNMSWTVHLFFNLFFLLLSILAIITHNRERRLIGTV